MGRKDSRRRKAEDLEASGWEALGMPELGHSGNLRDAEEYFRQALAIDPELGDAYNGLGTILYFQQRLAEAEAMFRTALVKARAELGTDKPRAFQWWGEISTRPYMRARHNLGLVFWRQGKLNEAIREFQQLLQRNPRDNQGARYVIGGLYHLLGEVGKAIQCYSQADADRFGGSDPHTEFNWGLAEFQTKRYDDSVRHYRCAFFLNPYLPQVVLYRNVIPMDIWHGTNLAEPNYALDYWENYSQLWIRRPQAVTFLRFVYEDDAVQTEMQEVQEIRRKLGTEKSIRARSPLVDEWQRLIAHDRIESTNTGIASRVIVKFHAPKGPAKRG